MRPLDKGLCPIDPATGLDKTVNDYDQWRTDLIDRIGYYCAYCNIPLSHSLQVEHVVPKNPMPGHPAGSLLGWDNMLLACGPCNGPNAKGNKPFNRTLYYTPEDHNPLFAFQIIAHSSLSNAAIIAPQSSLTDAQTKKANDTINLFKWKQVDSRPDVVDIRWRRRFDTKVLVEISYQLYQEIKLHSPTLENLAAKNIAIQAKQAGFFLLWFSAFAAEPQVMEKLIDPTIIPGTAQNCFDAHNGFILKHKNPGDLNDPF